MSKEITWPDFCFKPITLWTVRRTDSPRARTEVGRLVRRPWQPSAKEMVLAWTSVVVVEVMRCGQILIAGGSP